MSRFAVDPRWLVYLPPTMAPTATSESAGLLEHPAEAFADFRRAGVARVVCEEKHMGSRAVVVVCRDDEVAAPPVRRDHGAADEGRGRRRHAHRAPVLRRPRPTRWRCSPRCAPGSTVGRAVGRAGHRLGRPRRRAAAVVGEGRRPAASAVRLGRGGGHGHPRRRGGRARGGRAPGAPTSTTCWPRTLDRHGDGRAGSSTPTAATAGRSTSVDDLRLAPFQVLAGEGGVHALTRPRVAPRGARPPGRRRPRRPSEPPRRAAVDLGDPASEAAAAAWWDGAHRPRRRGHGGQAGRGRAPWAPRA